MDDVTFGRLPSLGTDEEGSLRNIEVTDLDPDGVRPRRHSINTLLIYSLMLDKTKD